MTRRTPYDITEQCDEKAGIAQYKPGRVLHLSVHLHVALRLLAKAHSLFERFQGKERRTLLQIPAKRFMTSAAAEITDQELHSPFVYLTRLNQDLYSTLPEGNGSSTVRFPQLVGPKSNPLDMPVERVFASLRFKQRGRLAELPIEFDGQFGRNASVGCGPPRSH
jgi:hypothetical protein